MPVLDIHVEGLETSSELSRYYMPKAILPRDVIQLLNREKIPFVLVGAHGVFGWMGEARATKDVDVLVAARQHKKAVKVLLAAFPDLEAVELDVVTRLKDRETQQVRIDVMKPNQQPHREIFKHTETVRDEGQTFRIPSLEMALVMKFAPMISLHRMDEDKFQDAHDFILMVKNNRDKIDKDKLAAIASMIYPDGGKDAVEMVRKVLAGEKLTL